MITQSIDEPSIFLSTQPADRDDRRLALLIITLSVIVLAAIAPFAGKQLPRVKLFLSTYESALVICDVVTAVLLYGQFAISRSGGMLVLASGYLFSASMATFHLLSFPGLFSPTGLLGSGPQTTAWLYFMWHLGFPSTVIAYALMRDDKLLSLPVQLHGAGRSVGNAAAVAVAVAIFLMLFATMGHGVVPTLMRGNEDLPAKYVVAWGTWLVTLAALPVLWRRGRLSVLDLWLMVVISAWLCDVGQAAVFNVGRFSLGWYTGRIYGLLASVFLLALLILEAVKLHAQVAAARLGERNERRQAEKTSAKLWELNETLESRVRERTDELKRQVEARMRTEEALREREARFRLFFVNSLEANFLTAPDGAILDANPEACRLFGRTKEEFQMLGRAAIVDATDPRLVPALEERARTGRFRGELRLLRKDGDLLECDVSSVFFRDEYGQMRTHMVVRDVTEQKRAEAELREERNFMGAILDTTSGLILTMDTDGRIVRFNKACESASGMSAAQVHGKKKWEVLVPDDERGGVRKAFEAVRSGPFPTYYENHWERPDGTRRLIAWSNTCVLDASGGTRFILSSGIDVTEQRRAELELSLRQRHMARLHRLQTMGALTAELAHEVNQPLAAIAGYAEATLGQVKRGDYGDRVQSNLLKIVQQVDRAARPIKELRRFLAREAPSKVPSELDILLRAGCSLVARLAAAHLVRLEYAEVDPALMVMAEPMQVEHVLVNLLQNAIEAVVGAGTSGGQVTLRAYHSEGERSVCIEIEDNGPGVDSNQVAHVFEPLYTTKENGLGLGLAICHSIVEAQGGKIWAAPGPGGKFSFTLPVKL